MEFRSAAVELFRKTQDEICAQLCTVDGEGEFQLDAWQRPEGGALSGGGGGETRIITGARVFESAGVNFSEVHGTLPQAMVQTLIGEDSPREFYATGISLVLHPFSPMIPTVHANFRYLEVGGKSWFGGGADLTPYYLFEEDAKHFHQTWREVCGEKFYREAKQSCDTYFYLPHRQEARGVGGIFYDYLGRDEGELAECFELTENLCAAFIPSYLPIVAKRKSEPWGEQEKKFQLLRRGRYVEFNLLYDRGTQFGLKTNGRTESILMSLPPQVAWEYCYTAEPGSREAKLLDTLSSPQDWV